MESMGKAPGYRAPAGYEAAARQMILRPERKTGEQDGDIGCDPVHDVSAHARYLG
jgi:hypothetical protein